MLFSRNSYEESTKSRANSQTTPRTNKFKPKFSLFKAKQRASTGASSDQVEEENKNRFRPNKSAFKKEEKEEESELDLSGEIISVSPLLE